MGTALGKPEDPARAALEAALGRNHPDSESLVTESSTVIRSVAQVCGAFPLECAVDSMDRWAPKVRMGHAYGACYVYE